MKTALSSTFVLAVLAGTFWQPDQSSEPQPSRQRVALVDMARVFKANREFVDRRDDLRSEIEASQRLDKQMAAVISKLEEELKKLTKGTAEHADAEQELIKLKRELEDFRRQQRRKLVTSESQLYKEIYTKVVAAIRQVAEQRAYTLVLRFDSEPLDASDVKTVLKKMNRQVVFYREQDEITDLIIKAVNDKHGERAD